MPWLETIEHNTMLFDALTELALERGALERLAGAINADERAQATDRARRGRKHMERHTIVAESTLVRWQEEGLSRVMNAQPHKKRIVYEFLERSPEFMTQLYKPASNLPHGFMAFVAAHSARLTQPFEKDLRKLDGAFTLYRPAWTTPDRSDRVLVSRLEFRTENGFTRFREEQDYIDDGFHGAQIMEIDEGAVLFTASNIIMLGFGVNGERVKLFTATRWLDQLQGKLPVVHISGTMMGISGRRENPGFPFVAIRSKKPFSEIATGIIPCSDLQLDLESLHILGLVQT